MSTVQPNEGVCIAALATDVVITKKEKENEKKKGKKNLSYPPDGYVCKVCHKPGHWIQQCPDPKKNKKTKKSKKKNSSTAPIHVPIPGVDPSKIDIEKAKQLQKLKPPMCFCRISSRLKKVKRSFATANEQQHQQQNHRGQGERGGYQRVGGASTSNQTKTKTNPNFTPYVEPDYEQSRAIGNYFFFCSKKKKDVTKCRFARPVQDHEDITPKAQRPCAFFVKYGRCKKGDACAFLHEENGKSMQYAKENNTITVDAEDNNNEDNKKRKRKADDSNNIDTDVAVVATIEDSEKSNNKKKKTKKENSTTTRPIDNEKPTMMRGEEGGSSDSNSDSSSESDSDHNTTEIKEITPTTTIIRSNSDTSSSNDNDSESTNSDGSDDDDDDDDE